MKHLFRYQAYFEENLLRFVCARAHVQSRSSDRTNLMPTQIADPLKADLHGTTLTRATSLQQAYDMT